MFSKIRCDEKILTFFKTKQGLNLLNDVAADAACSSSGFLLQPSIG